MRDSQDAFHGTSAVPERAAVTRLQAYRLASVSVFASIVLLLPGCQGALSSGTADRPRPASSPTGPTIDAGIILSDRESYLCIPFEKIGVAPDAEITPANLAVLIDLLLADGSARQFTTNVLRTSIAPEVPR
jgi:hypothetical protein